MACIQIKTIELVFHMLDNDIRVFETITDGKSYYERRIDDTFKRLADIEAMIDSATTSVNGELSEFTNVDTRLRSRSNTLKQTLLRKLKNLKGLNWEREMRVAGFRDVEPKGDMVIRTVRRRNCGDKEVIVHD
jgi:hypothetical protein